MLPVVENIHVRVAVGVQLLEQSYLAVLGASMVTKRDASTIGEHLCYDDLIFGELAYQDDDRTHRPDVRVISG